MDLTFDVHGVPIWGPGAALLGVGVGFVAGMFGVGGGFLLTPLLVVCFGLPFPVAAGTGLCQIVGTSFASLLRHRELGQGELRFDLLTLAGGLWGVHAGERALAALAQAGSFTLAGRSVPLVTLCVDLGYMVLLLTTAAMFWRKGAGGIEEVDYVRIGPLARVRLGPGVDLPRVPLRRVSALLVAHIGLGLGFLSGLLGIGGGVALMPLLVYGFGFPLRQAAGTGILMIFVTSLVGTSLHARRGNVHLGLAAVLLVGATVSAQLGATLTRRLPVGPLRRGFALVILGTVSAVTWDLMRRIH